MRPIPSSPAIRPSRRSASFILGAMVAAVFAASATAGEMVVERDVAVPMRDGVVLRAHVFRPAGGGSHPVLVMRTPYGKDARRDPATYVNAGYIVVTQDARGRYASDGQYESLYKFGPHDATDGYDTVEWAARLPGANGRVGTYGISYDAFLQWRLAALRPPALVAMAAFSIPPRLTDIEGPGTIRPGRRLDWYYLGMTPEMRRRSGRPGPVTKDEARALWNGGMEGNLYYFLPWLDLPDFVFENDTEDMKNWLRHPEVDPWRLLDGCKDIAVPNLNVVGWFDHCNDSIQLFGGMRREGRTPVAREGQRLIIGPWSHVSLGQQQQGSLDFGPEAKLDLEQETVRWFDRWLKGREPDSTNDPAVRIFIMGANRWRNEMEWPLKREERQILYLDSGGRANTPAGDGRLSSAAPEAAGTDRYRYDPRIPVPTLWTERHFTIPADQRPLAGRDDILVYQTEPLKEALEVTGYPEATLYVSASVPDTDFFARLIDVAPDGLARDVAMGMVRARYRQGLDRPVLLKPGELTEIRIRLRPTANEFQPGHRIRLDITSSDFPNYDRNHNTAADQNSDAELAVADLSIHHGGKHRSSLNLPVIPRARQASSGDGG